MTSSDVDTDHLASLEYSMMEGHGRRRRGRRHGSWTFTDQAGVLRAEGKFRDGIEHGHFRYWSAGGDLECEREWSAGSATTSRWWTNAMLQCAVEQRADGASVTTYYFPTGRPSRRETHRGRRVRVETWYAFGGRERSWTLVGDEYVGTIRWFGADGRPSATQAGERDRMFEDGRCVWDAERRDRVRHGVSLTYDYFGNIVARQEWRDGELNGPSTYDALDGTRAVVRHRRGRRHGAARIEWPSGRPRWRARYRDGTLHGELRGWHANGQLERSGHVVDGRLEGQWAWFDADGACRATLEFRAGRVTLPASVQGPAGPITVRRRRDADAVLRIDPATGALDIDEHGRLGRLAPAELARFLQVERARTIDSIWTPGEGDVPTRPRDVAGPTLPAGDDSIHALRRTDGSLSIRRRRTGASRWTPIHAIGTGTVDDRPVLHTVEVSPSGGFVAIVFDVDGGEQHYRLRVLDLATARLVHEEEIPAAWAPGGSAAVWAAGDTLCYVGTRAGDRLCHWDPAQGASEPDEGAEAAPAWTRLVAAEYGPGQSSAVALLHSSGSPRLAAIDTDTGEPSSETLPDADDLAVVVNAGHATVVLDRRHVLAAPLPLTSAGNDWRLLRAAQPASSVQCAVHDGSTTATIDGHAGRPVVRVTRVGQPDARFGPAELGFLPIALSFDEAGSLQVWSDAERSVDLAPGSTPPTPAHPVTYLRARTENGDAVEMTAWLPPHRPARGVLVATYGGYGHLAIGPGHSMRASLLDQGIAVVVAHVRGGGERGRDGHEEGRGARKLQTVRDVVACVEHVRRRIADRVVLLGGSHGALVMAGAAHDPASGVRGVVLTVPQLDLWQGDQHHHELAMWGRSDPIERDLIRAASPYATMPASVGFDVLAVTGTKDGRVPWDAAARYVRRARDRAEPGVSALLWAEPGTGHGLGTGSMRADRERVMTRFIVRSIERS